jgi:hypothetical protein
VTIADVIAPLRASLVADGADVEVVDYDAEAVQLRLILRDARCEECLLPHDMLEQLFLRAVQSAIPTVRTVTLDDPREASDRTT